jgi:Predicted membrane protein
MKELESLLSDIPLEEREEALSYYNGYIEDAGEEHEEDILRELGSPAKVAGIIKADLNLNVTDRESSGCFTEKGYQDTIYPDAKFELVGGTNKDTKDSQSQQNQTSGNQSTSQGNRTNANQYSNGSRVLIIILICVFGSPFILSALGVVIGIVSAILGIIVGFGAAGIAMFFAGLALFIAGIAEIAVPFVGFLMCGAGLIVFGLGMLFLTFTALLCKYVLPAIFKGVVNVCRMPFQNRSVIA